MTVDLLNEAVLAKALGARPFRYFDRVGSTNDVARQWALDGAPAGAVVIANEQTSGRGRLGRDWQTPSGQALALSMVLRPALDPQDLQRVTMLGGVAVVETLARYMERQEIGLKWPNDVLGQGRKICGVLSEALWIGNELAAVILGMGVNVRMDFAGTPLEDVAGSLEDYAPDAINRADLIRQLLGRLDFWQACVGEALLVETWRTWLATLGQRVQIRTQDGLVEGVARDVDGAGALLLQGDDGHEWRVLVGDVMTHP